MVYSDTYVYWHPIEDLIRLLNNTKSRVNCRLRQVIVATYKEDFFHLRSTAHFSISFLNSLRE
jgi:hypothetical protein